MTANRRRYELALTSHFIFPVRLPLGRCTSSGCLGFQASIWRCCYQLEPWWSTPDFFCNKTHSGNTLRLLGHNPTKLCIHVQSTFSQCITPVPNFFYALWHSMQDEMCHKAWLSVTSAKNVTLRKSLRKTGKYCVFTWYQHSWERDYYWKKNWEKFVCLSSLEQCGAVPNSRNFEAFVHTSHPQIWTRVCT